MDQIRVGANEVKVARKGNERGLAHSRVPPRLPKNILKGAGVANTFVEKSGVKLRLF